MRKDAVHSTKSGNTSKKLQYQEKKLKIYNDGYDDENNDYIIRPGEVWEDRFEIKQCLGKGSFGQVVHAFDRDNQEEVAIKIVKNRKSFAVQAQVEIRILKCLNAKDPDNVHPIGKCLYYKFLTSYNDTLYKVRMKEHFVYRNHVCIVYELLAYNLYELLKKGRFKGLPFLFVRKFAVQILVGLRFLSKPDIQIIHCDLKPEKCVFVVGVACRMELTNDSLVSF
jgi:dual specificity tyrosine-phosphorylation-regulated kinase 1